MVNCRASQLEGVGKGLKEFGFGLGGLGGKI